VSGDHRLAKCSVRIALWISFGFLQDTPGEATRELGLC
jgi:hypothetical protein